MFRSIVFFAFCTLFALASLAQDPGNLTAGSAPNDRLSENSKPALPPAAMGAITSVARLSVPRKARQLYKKALDAWVNGLTTEAQRNVDQSLKMDPAFPEALSLSGVIQLESRQWSLAEENLRAAIKSDPKYFPPYTVLAEVYNRQGRFEDAQQATNRALSAGAEGWALQYEIARALIGKQQFESALAIADTSLRTSRHASLLHIAKAHALMGLQRYPEAANEMRDYLRENPAGYASQDARNTLKQIEGVTSR